MQNHIASQVAEALKNDKMRDAFLDMSEEERVMVCLAYIEADAKKFERFVSAYLTRSEVRDFFRETVFNSLKLAA